MAFIFIWHFYHGMLLMFLVGCDEFIACMCEHVFMHVSYCAGVFLCLHVCMLLSSFNPCKPALSAPLFSYEETGILLRCDAFPIPGSFVKFSLEGAIRQAKGFGTLVVDDWAAIFINLLTNSCHICFGSLWKAFRAFIIPHRHSAAVESV